MIISELYLKKQKFKHIKIALLFLFFAGLLLIGSCRKDFSTSLSSGQLEFSKDTVFLDTVFSKIGSGTYALKVYNRSKDAIRIPSIQLDRGETSGYRLNVDGISGKYFENIDILAKDSIFIFIETTIDYSLVSDLLYVDKLLFDSGANRQEVPLITLVQDAHFLYPNKINGMIETLIIDGETTTVPGRYLTDSELVFTNEKPYVIYGYMVVGGVSDTPKTLTMQAGAKVHFHANSGLIVNKNSSLNIQGSLNIEGQAETEVLLEGDRLEFAYSDVPGQWGLIWLREGSTNHQINYATIKNGSIGLLVDGMSDTGFPTLYIKNTQIYNHAQYGMVGRQAHIKGENLVINNAGFSSLAASQGGRYDFTHCTFANYWNAIRNYPTILVNNFYTLEDNSPVGVDLSAANFTNCIITGNNNIELILDKVDTAAFDYHFSHNLLQFDDTQNDYTDNPLYNFDNTNHYFNNILNADPNFREVQENDFIIGENSGGNRKAATDGTSQVPTDILGVTRSVPADIGAYEHIIF